MDVRKFAETVSIIGSSLLFAISAQAQSVLYVDINAAGPTHDGSSWCDAYIHLQDALTAAKNSGGTVTEIRVAGGIYRPDRNEASPEGTGNREATFQLLNGVALRGGYVGCGADDPDERDIALYETILSGDLNGNDDSTGPPGSGGNCCTTHDSPGCDNTDCETAVCSLCPECCNEKWFCYCGWLAESVCCSLCSDNVTWCENSLHVVTGNGTDGRAVLDGFTITAGNANDTWGDYRDRGGGMHNHYGSPMLVNCAFRGNSAISVGGGMYRIDLRTQTVTNCTFTENTARSGAGIHNAGDRLVLTDCMFTANSADHHGGGMVNSYARPTLVSCTFTANSANGYGGGMLNLFETSSTLTNCVFRDNSAQDGGAVHNFYADATLFNCALIGNSSCRFGAGMVNSHGSSTVVNCTFAANSAPRGRAVGAHDYCGTPEVPSSVDMTNCILRDGGEEIWDPNMPTVTVIYSDVEGGWPGEGNIDEDPLFVPGPGGCFYLSQIAAGQAVDSPCVNTGSDTAANLDLDTMTTRSDEGVDTGIVDMGYHYPLTGEPLIMGDYDRDADVDLADFAAFQNCFTGPPVPGEEPVSVSPCCRIFDFAEPDYPDNDVDLDDYADFWSALTGP